MKDFKLTSKKILGIDHGGKRIGLALADLQTKLAFPDGVIENRGAKFVVSYLKNFCQKENIIKIVVGMPYSLRSSAGQGQENTSNWQKEVNKFVKILKKFFKIPIILEDERLSTKIIQSFKKSYGIKEKLPKDAISAAVILQNYLDKK